MANDPVERVRPHPLVSSLDELHGEARKRDAPQFSSPSLANVDRLSSGDCARGHHLVRLQKLIMRLLHEYCSQMRDGGQRERHLREVVSRGSSAPPRKRRERRSQPVAT